MQKRMQIKIGVMGSASGPTIRDPAARRLAFELGQAIARRGCSLINGACPGLPDEAAAGARSEGGFVFGVSPAFSEREHLEIYSSPVEHLDMILYSGMGLMERDIVNIRSSDAIVIVGGGVGTLNEFTVAYEEQKPVGVLAGTGGIADHIDEIMAFCNRTPPPGRILTDAEPARLVDRLLEVLRSHRGPVRESDIGGVQEAPADESATADARGERLREQHVAHDQARQHRADDESD